MYLCDDCFANYFNYRRVTENMQVFNLVFVKCIKYWPEILYRCTNFAGPSNYRKEKRRCFLIRELKSGVKSFMIKLYQKVKNCTIFYGFATV